MNDLNFDQLLGDYKQTINARINAIRDEEALANDDHSMVEMEKWDSAGLHVYDAELAAKRPAIFIKMRCAGRTTDFSC